MITRLGVLALSLAFSAAAFAQSGAAVREQLFGPTDALKKAADAVHAKMLGPDAYEQAMELYKDAGDTLAKGKDINTVKEDLTKASALFQKSTESAKLAQVTFADAITARTSAEKAESAKYAAKEWNKGESTLQDAAQQLEEGSLNKAQKTVDGAKKYYAAAETKAVNEKAKAAHK
jgi:hypothetical protein